MTVIRPNSVSGINSITVQSGNSLAVHKANGELLRTITGTTGVSTFSSISVGTAYTDNSAAKSINVGVGASIAQHNDNTLTFGTAGDPRITIDASGDLNVGSAATIKAGGNATFSGIVTAANFVGNGSGLTNLATDLVNDTSPQLGGLLDGNGQTANFTGNNTGLGLPRGTTAQEPSAGSYEGYIRYNSDDSVVYYSNGTNWLKIASAVPTLTSVTGSIVDGAATTLTLAGTNFLGFSTIC